MRIQVKGDGHSINIPIPTGLIFSKPSVWLYLKLAKKYSSQAPKYIPEDAEQAAENMPVNIPKEAMYALCAELIRIKRKHGSWVLVEVQSASGEEVRITL